MLIEIPDVFSKQEVSQLREQLDTRRWIDGNQTSGAMASTRKRNQQLDKDDPVAVVVGQQIMDIYGHLGFSKVNVLLCSNYIYVNR